MGKYEVLKHFVLNEEKYYTIRELSKELNISVRNVRRSVMALEQDKLLLGKCWGTATNWNRHFRAKVK